MQYVLLGLVASSAAAQAQNTSNVTVYGIVDTNLQFANGGGKIGNQNSLQSGSLSQSRLGFMGNEDLGGGLKAVFSIENGFNVDSGVAAQGGLLFGRHAYVGLASDAVGTLTLGRQYMPLHLLHVKFTTHQVGFADATASFIPQIDDVRFDNSIRYVSPSYNGVTANVFYALGENVTVPSAAAPDKRYGDVFNVQLNLERGQLLAALSYADKKKAPSIPGNHTKYAAGSVAYDFGAVKPYAIYETVRNDTATAATPDFNFWSLELEVPFGQGKWKASYGNLKNRTVANADAKSYGLLYEYLFSKRSSVYGGYSRVSNEGAAAYGVGSANGVAVVADGVGASPHAVAIGVRTKF
ncbi:porin [Duganella radicis]|nr:porin [Duganella radicis]